MTILLTGATGYIGKRLLPVLVEQGHDVICCVRDDSRLELKDRWDNVSTFEVDFAQPVNIDHALRNFDVAFYLMHSMNAGIGKFVDLEARIARNFVDYIDQTRAKQIIYLTGIVNSDELSEHLSSRLQVEEILQSSKVPLTALRAGIIVGSGSASFEIIRDLVEKLPIMIAPQWLNSKCQPIAIRNVIEFLTRVMLREDCYGRAFDIGSKEILSYREMLLIYASVRHLWRRIYTLPVMTPRLSSYWLYFITSTSYPLAVNLVNSMKIDVICEKNNLAEKLDIQLYNYEEAVRMAFNKIEQHMVASSWKDALSSSYYGDTDLNEYIEVPKYGCFTDVKSRFFQKTETERVMDNIFSIGGTRGWYYGNWMWRLRGFLDKLIGGVGLRRGRTLDHRIYPGDALDFWRVLVADRKNKRLLLYAEMKLPGEAWLEFSIQNKNGKAELRQLATFRPDGIFGRLYWYSVLPFHYFVFNGMINNLLAYEADYSISGTEN